MTWRTIATDRGSRGSSSTKGGGAFAEEALEFVGFGTAEEGGASFFTFGNDFFLGCCTLFFGYFLCAVNFGSTGGSASFAED
jgi:hypothetical protein